MIKTTETTESIFSVPRSIAELATHTDSESIRYALGGIELSSTAIHTTAVATDGRRLAVVQWRTDRDRSDVDNGTKPTIVDAKTIKAIGKKRPCITARGKNPQSDRACIVASDNRLTVEAGPTTTETKPLLGRYPKWRDVLPIQDHTVIAIDVGFLEQACALLRKTIFDATDERLAYLCVKDSKSPVFLTAENAEREQTAEIVIMPMNMDDKQKIPRVTK